MKELDKIKEVWKNQDKKSSVQFSKSDILEMLHKKSSSVVKWIFYISIIEFCFWIGISVVFDPNIEKLQELGIYDYMNILNFFNYFIILIFIVLFYKNYKQISITSTTQKLMEDILKTRKTVYYYVLYNISLALLSSATMLYFIFTNEDFLNKLRETQADATGDLNLILPIVISVIILIVVIGLLMLFYRLIYGTLLNRLKNNYRELSKN